MLWNPYKVKKDEEHLSIKLGKLPSELSCQTKLEKTLTRRKHVFLIQKQREICRVWWGWAPHLCDSSSLSAGRSAQSERSHPASVRLLPPSAPPDLRCPQAPASAPSPPLPVSSSGLRSQMLPVTPAGQRQSSELWALWDTPVKMIPEHCVIYRECEDMSHRVVCWDVSAILWACSLTTSLFNTVAAVLDIVLFG